jgi:CheY-like chemotaxis protein
MILIVEDNKMVIQAYHCLLENLKVHFYFAKTAQAALKALQENHFNLVFMDIHLPDRSGWELCQAIRIWEKENKNKDLMPIFAVSSHFNGFKEKAKATGFTGCIKKPLSHETLNRLIEQYCKKRKYQGWKN